MPTWRVPRNAASGGGSPRSARRWMFSSTTMASSTTRPIDSTSASSVSRLIEKPNASSGMKAAITHTGTVTAGTSAERAAAEEQPDHHQHQHDRLGQRLVDLVHGDVDEDRGVVGDGDLHALGQGAC